MPQAKSSGAVATAQKVKVTTKTVITKTKTIEKVHHDEDDDEESKDDDASEVDDEEDSEIDEIEVKKASKKRQPQAKGKKQA